MIGVFITFAGVTLFINGLRVLFDSSGKKRFLMAGKDVAVVNLFTGALAAVIVVLILVQGHDVQNYEYSPAAYVGLFSLTYLWLGINQFTGVSGNALGWFSFLVPFFAVPAGIAALKNATGPFEIWMAINWFAWAILWLLFFFLLTLNWTKIAKFTGAMTVIQAIVTAILPAIMLYMKVI